MICVFGLGCVWFGILLIFVVSSCRCCFTARCLCFAVGVFLCVMFVFFFCFGFVGFVEFGWVGGFVSFSDGFSFWCFCLFCFDLFLLLVACWGFVCFVLGYFVVLLGAFRVVFRVVFFKGLFCGGCVVCYVVCFVGFGVFAGDFVWGF